MVSSSLHTLSHLGWNQGKEQRPWQNREMGSFIYLEEEIPVSMLSAGETAFRPHREKGVISISCLPMSRPVQGLAMSETE